MAALYAIIFVTGGATLALELLASRVMTPYFGVSLYIWTGILSITLVAPAIGTSAPQWDAQRRAWVAFDATRNAWLRFDDATQQWHPLD